MEEKEEMDLAPYRAFAKSCAEQIMCTRHVPGGRDRIETALLQFDDKIRPMIIGMVKAEIQTIKKARNIDGATVVGNHKPQKKEKAKARNIDGATVVGNHKPQKKEKAKKPNPYLEIQSPRTVITVEESKRTDDGKMRVLCGQDLGCTQDEVADYRRCMAKK